MVMGYSPYPNAAKEYLRFMMEQEQYVPWQSATLGYWCHPLRAYDGSPVWTDDPKAAPYKNILRSALPQSYKGDPGEAAATVKAEMVVLNMFQAYVAGQLARRRRWPRRTAAPGATTQASSTQAIDPAAHLRGGSPSGQRPTAGRSATANSEFTR